MANSTSKGEYRNKPDIPDCSDKDNETQHRINVIKKTYCLALETAENEIENAKIGLEASEKIYKSKERRYLATSDNCERYTNTEISLGSQLVQANAKLKANTADYKKWDGTLADQLAAIFKSVKEVKTKMADLREAAGKLENSKSDSCCTSQWNIIIGRNESKEGQAPDSEHCKDIEKVVDMVFDMPKALSSDIDSIFKASSDIIGIQKFCNTGSLVVLQEKLSGYATEFDSLLQDTIKVRKTDLDSRQQELKDALAKRTGVVMDLYNLRCNYGGIHSTLKKICCAVCGCVTSGNDCQPRLEDCAEDICRICGEVKYAFVKEEAPAAAPVA
jgi:hypothetical protein